MIHITLFATDNMSTAARLCKQSAFRNGVNTGWVWNEYSLKQTDFYVQNKLILDQPRGFGFWAWKPFIILDIMNTRCNEGDILIYSDAGVEFINNVEHIISRMDQDIFLFGNMYDHQHWCKMDTMKELDVYPNGKQVQASVIFFRVNAMTKLFVYEWLSYCVNPHLIDDSPSESPNHPEFREHRHDQAILTCFAYAQGLKLHWWPAMYNNGAFVYEKGLYKDNYPVMFHHHRKRNHEFLPASKREAMA